MRVGVPKEIKDQEYRVGLVPATVRELTARGHAVLVERGAGQGAGISDDDYAAAGATLLAGAEELFARADLIVKVKEPLAAEYVRLRRGQILFTYLHLAAEPALTEALLAKGVTAIAYETVTAPDGRLPLLTPMSQVAGRMAPQVGAYWLEKTHGGRGMLLGGVPGVAPAEVVILGAGVVGSNAATIALGMGADVSVLARSQKSLQHVAQLFGDRVRAIVSTAESIDAACRRADLLIGAVLVDGARAPRIVTAETVRAMKPGAVFVDVSIDQGGCSATSRPTTHSQPTYVVDGVVHYCVTNMPGAVPRTSAFALDSTTRPFVLALADNGTGALRADAHLRAGLNVHAGRLTCRPVAEALGLPFTPAAAALAS
ncbi:MAG: alanine dehydrogenase [Pseudolabrys sp.]